MTHRTTPTASPNADGPFGLPPHIRHLVQTHSHETGEASEGPPTYTHSLAHHRELLPNIEGIRWTSTPSQWPLPISEQQISLGGYAAKTCPTATHHQFDPTAPAPQVIDDPADAQRKADGIEFEAHVLDLIEEVCGRADAAHPEGLWRIDEDQFQTIAKGGTYATRRDANAAHTAETMRAIEAGALLISGGRLPDAGHRNGKPDLLLRAYPRTHPGSGPVNARYWPGDIKAHSTLENQYGPRRKHRASLIEAPTRIAPMQGFSVKSEYRRKDGMQLAHYTRLLQDLDLHPGTHRHGGTHQYGRMYGFVIGTSDYATVLAAQPRQESNEEHTTRSSAREWPTTSRLALTWHDLNEPLFEEISALHRTHAPEDGRVHQRPVLTGQVEPYRHKISILDLYDGEFAQRVQVAHVAAQQGQPQAPAPVTIPTRRPECGSCQWFTHCDDIRDARDASWAFGAGPLTDREWALLREAGYGTVEALAEAPVGAPGGPAADPAFLDSFATWAGPFRDSADRLRLASWRSRMARDGIALWRREGAVLDLPVHDIEIDFDIEDAEEHVYLYGLNVTRRGETTGRYVPIDDLPGCGTDEPVQDRALAFFTDLIREAEQTGQSLAIYHWTHHERSQVKKVNPALFEAIDGYMVDMHKRVKAAFFDRDGLSIKTVAPLAGFAWAADDAGGDVSRIHYATATTHPDPAQRQEAARWLRDYNGDDCRATLVLRQFLRDLADAEHVHTR